MMPQAPPAPPAPPATSIRGVFQRAAFQAKDWAPTVAFYGLFPLAMYAGVRSAGLNISDLSTGFRLPLN